jgi:hypothetical protein
VAEWVKKHHPSWLERKGAAAWLLKNG